MHNRKEPGERRRRRRRRHHSTPDRKVIHTVSRRENAIKVKRCPTPQPHPELPCLLLVPRPFVRETSVSLLQLLPKPRSRNTTPRVSSPVPTLPGKRARARGAANQSITDEVSTLGRIPKALKVAWLLGPGEELSRRECKSQPSSPRAQPQRSINSRASRCRTPDVRSNTSDN